MAELSESSTIKLLAIVHGNFFRHAEAAYDVLPEKFCKVEAVMSCSALASIHFEKYSTTTAAYLKLPGAVGRGPMMTMPHRTRGQTRGIGWTSFGGNLL